MPNIEDLFGKMPGRPEHEHFWRLSQIVLKMDSDLDPSNPDEEAKHAQWTARMGEVDVNVDSVLYMATQRAYRIHGVTNPFQLMMDPGLMMEVARTASIWTEAFATGVFYEREYGL